MKVTYNKENKSQIEFLEDFTNRGIIFLAGRGAGKSFGGNLKLLKWLQIPKTTHMVVAPTYKQLAVVQDTLWDIMYNHIQYSPEEEAVLSVKSQKHQPYLVKNYNKKDFDLQTIFGSTVHFRSGDNPDSLRGYNLTTFWLDEPSLVDVNVYDNLLLALRRPGTLGKTKQKNLGTSKNNKNMGLYPTQSLSTQYWLTTTPKGFNWIYDKIPELRVYQATTMDNKTLPKEYLDALPQGGAWYKQEVLGQFVELQGLVFAGDYTIGELPDTGKVLNATAGIDFGYNSPTAVVYIIKTMLPNSGTVYYAYDEIYQTELTSSDLLSIIKDRVTWGDNGSVYYHWAGLEQSSGLERFGGLTKNTVFGGYFADPANPQLIEDLRRGGLSVRKANNDILFGVNEIKKYPLIIHPRCVNLIAELERYSWGANDKPLKGFDHAIDALRYGVVGLNSGSVQSARVLWQDTDRYLWEKLQHYA
jgi:phage terminase large subunit